MIPVVKNDEFQSITRVLQATIVKKQRPVNLQLNTISFPPSAISSILHRATGVALFFALLFTVAVWALSLTSAQGFENALGWVNSAFGKFVLIGTLSALSYHIIGGLRHLVMDMGHWEELESGNTSAMVSIGLWLLLTVILGVVLW